MVHLTGPLCYGLGFRRGCEAADGDSHYRSLFANSNNVTGAPHFSVVNVRRRVREYFLHGIINYVLKTAIFHPARGTFSMLSVPVTTDRNGIVVVLELSGALLSATQYSIPGDRVGVKFTKDDTQPLPRQLLPLLVCLVALAPFVMLQLLIVLLMFAFLDMIARTYDAIRDVVLLETVCLFLF